MALIFIFLFKLVETFIFISEKNAECFNSGIWVELPTQGWGDEGYISSAENWIQTGEWKHEASGLEASRVPGVGFHYLLLRVFLSPQQSLNGLIVLCTIISSIGFIVFLKSLSAKKWIVLTGIVLFLGDSYLSSWSISPFLAESYCVGYTFLAIGFLRFWKNSKNQKFLLISGLFFGISILTRVTFFPVIFCIAVFIFFFDKFSLKNAVIYLLPFFLLESIWVTRNYLVTGTFVPFQQIGTAKWTEKKDGLNAVKEVEFQSETNFNSSYKEDLEFLKGECNFHELYFVKTFGGNWVSWNPNSAIFWLKPHSEQLELTKEIPSLEKAFPDFIFNDEKGLTKDLLIDAKKYKETFFDRKASDSIRVVAGKKYFEILSSFKENLKETPLNTLMKSKLFLTRQWLFSSGTYQIPYSFSSAGIVGKLIKLKAMIFYYLIVVTGLISIFLLLLFNLKSTLMNKAYVIVLGVIFVLYHWTLYVIVFKTSELRYNCFLIFGLFIILIGILEMVQGIWESKRK
tara:strand:+ start:1061 stop:2602 length:1542 start_codon:yes stop_codon:yes gene_type:complete